jgi:hypothetical protein
MKTYTVNTYEFNELSAEAQKVAISNNIDVNTHYDWWSCTYEKFKETAKNAGFEVDKIYFSGFYSQGDGAMFEGSIHPTDLYKLLRLYPESIDKRVIRLIESGVIEFQWKVNHRGHYYHSRCSNMYFYYNFFYNNCNDYKNIEAEIAHLEGHIEYVYHTICSELYKSLQAEYDYLSSEEAIKEALIVNNYEFLENGKNY